MTVLVVLAAGFGNAGMAWIFAGQVLLFPIVGLCRVFTAAFGMDVTIPYSDSEVLVANQDAGTINIVPSIWVVQVVYFFVYLWFNANNIYNADPIDIGPEYTVKVNNRKSRTMMIMVFVGVFLSLLLGARFLVKGDILNALVSAVIGWLFAWTWNVVGNQPNLGINTMDIFGISQQMMIVPNTDANEVATLCEASNL
jgi:hypothetical protein